MFTFCYKSVCRLRVFLAAMNDPNSHFRSQKPSRFKRIPRELSREVCILFISCSQPHLVGGKAPRSFRASLRPTKVILLIVLSKWTEGWSLTWMSSCLTELYRSAITSRNNLHTAFDAETYRVSSNVDFRSYRPWPASICSITQSQTFETYSKGYLIPTSLQIHGSTLWWHCNIYRSKQH